MRAIDADALKATLRDTCSASNNVKQRRIEDSILHGILPQIIDDEPTIDTEPQESEWQIVALRTVYDDIPYGHSYVCKNCGHTEGRNNKYCGGCGCKMIGVDYG